MSSSSIKYCIVLSAILIVFLGLKTSISQISQSSQYSGETIELKRTESFTNLLTSVEIIHYLLQKDISGGHITIEPSMDDQLTLDVEYVVKTFDTAKGQEHLNQIKTSLTQDKNRLNISSIAPRNYTLFTNNGGRPPFLNYEQVNYKVHMPASSSVQELKAITDNGNIKINGMKMKLFDLMNDDGNVELVSCSGDLKINTDNGSIYTQDCALGKVDLNTDDGNIFLAGASGPVDVNIDNGSIHIKNCNGKIRLNADDGNIELESVNGTLHANLDNGSLTTIGSTFQEVDVSIDDGNIQLGHATGKIKLHTDNGDINLSDSNGDIQYSTDDGNVIVQNSSGMLKGKTDNGSVQIQNGNWSEIQLETDDGNVQIESQDAANTKLKITGDNSSVNVTLPATEDVHIEVVDGNIQFHSPVIKNRANLKSVNGQVTVYVQPEQPYAFHVKTRNGKIQHSLPLTNVKNEQKNELYGTLHGGSIPVNVETKDGSVSLLPVQ